MKVLGLGFRVKTFMPIVCKMGKLITMGFNRGSKGPSLSRFRVLKFNPCIVKTFYCP
jgi:hypothetical protein